VKEERGGGAFVPEGSGDVVFHFLFLYLLEVHGMTL